MTKEFLFQHAKSLWRGFRFLFRSDVLKISTDLLDLFAVLLGVAEIQKM